MLENINNPKDFLGDLSKKEIITLKNNKEQIKKQTEQKLAQIVKEFKEFQNFKDNKDDFNKIISSIDKDKNNININHEEIA